MTMNTYAHALDSEELEVALAIDELLADGYASSGRDLSTMTPIEVAVETPLVVKPVGPKYPNGPRSGVEAEAAVRKYAQSQMGEFTKREAMEACEISSQKWMSNALVKLQREGVIKKLGTSKDARYRTLKAS